MTYVISDLHGHFRESQKMLSKIGFSSGDRLLLAGDLTDKGPCPVECVRFAMETPGVTTLLGNHDLMAAEAIRDGMQGETFARWKRNEGEATYAAFRRESAGFIEHYTAWVSRLPCYELVLTGGQPFAVCHAGADFIGLERQASLDPADVLAAMAPHEIVWNRYALRLARKPALLRRLTHTVVCGHTPTWQFCKKRGGKILDYGNLICIDCGAAYSEYPWSALGCLRLEDRAQFTVPCR